MDRRTFLMSGACCPASLVGVWTPASARTGNTTLTALVVVDASLPHGAAFAASLDRMNVRMFDLAEAGEEDIGMLWHTRIARHIVRGQERDEAKDKYANPLLAGLARASDYFVLQALATRAGYAPRHVQTIGNNRSAPQTHFVLAPRAWYQNL